MQALVRWQLARPALFLGLSALLTAASAMVASTLRVQTGFESLLPESRDSVKELRRVASRTQGMSTVYVVLEGGEGTSTAQLREAANALVGPLKAIGEPAVVSVETGVHDAIRFLEPRAGLFVPLERLERVADELEQSYARAVAAATGLFIELDDAPPAEQRMDLTALRRELADAGVSSDRYPDGYYQSRDGRALVVLVRSRIAPGEFDLGSAAMASIRRVVEANDPRKVDPKIRFGFAGDLVSAVAEFEAVNANLLDVGVMGIALVAGIVLLYYMRLRPLLVMLVTIASGVAWTFGLTALTIGRLNIATGFLFTIITGNGINFGLLLMARYLELRRAGRPTDSALTEAVLQVWKPTLTAAMAAGAAYGSLAVTDFRGFRDFGFIGGAGMVLCWSATFLVTPPLLVLVERFRPMIEPEGLTATSTFWQRWRRNGTDFSAPFVALAARFPTQVAALGGLATIAGLVSTVRWLAQDPMEYDLHAMRSDLSARAEEVRLGTLGNEVTGHVGAAGMAIVVDRLEDVEPLRAALLARKAAIPPELAPFDRLHALQDYVPTQQAEKVVVLARLRKVLLKAHARGALTGKDWDDVSRVLPPEGLAPFSMAELPTEVAQAFTESDGTRGRVIYISPTIGSSLEDARYLFRWADAYRRTELPGNRVVFGSGRAVIYADMWAAVIADVPRAIGLSLLVTLVVIALAFRLNAASGAVFVSLAMGITWTGAALALLGIKINFLNFVAVPVTFGIGADYSINVVQRWVNDGPGSAIASVRATGAAVVLCSLTTMLGYLALLGSTNFGVRSLGFAAFLGEVFCIVSSVLVLPALLVLWDRRGQPDRP